MTAAATRPSAAAWHIWTLLVPVGCRTIKNSVAAFGLVFVQVTASRPILLSVQTDPLDRFAIGYILVGLRGRQAVLLYFSSPVPKH